ncbi:unnamed protein product [Allacma fusca]|uniref:Peptidase S1 domain-containing protein n=2 Tax=Allacma fusca TaxID=39272 RepID=A0A8J2KHY3_9HEXA|nr:unnamed protein product [Allacma fusca]
MAREEIPLSSNNISSESVNNNRRNRRNETSSCGIRRVSQVASSFYFWAILIFVLVASAVLYTCISWNPAVEPTSNCDDFISENFFLRENIPIDSDSYNYCEETLPLFEQCGHPMTDSYVFRRRKKRVAGGTVVSNRTYYPWMASLLQLPTNDSTGQHLISHNCGATVISKRYLLTAAHCLICNSFENIEVELRNGVRMNVMEILIHPDYERDCSSEEQTSRENDIALVRLDEEIQDVEPICLPLRGCYSLNETDIRFQSGMVAGYGITSNGSEEAANDLHHVSLDRASFRLCAKTYNRNGTILIRRESTICAQGTNGADFCRGDSGSPLFISVNSRSVQIGIASFGSSNCGDGSPSVFTGISYNLLRWIQNETSLEQSYGCVY